MKNNYFIATLFALLGSIFISNSQNLDWTNPPATGTGNASIAIIADPPAVLLNSNSVTTVGSLLGVFYENNDGDLSCAGYVELNQTYMDGGNINLAVWGADSGQDNGVSNGNPMQFYLQKDGIDYSVENIIWTMGDEIFTPNGLYVISQINFQSQELAPCSCSDSSIITEISTISNPNDACSENS